MESQDLVALVGSLLVFVGTMTALFVQNARQSRSFRQEMQPMNGGIRGAIDKYVIRAEQSRAELQAAIDSNAGAMGLATYLMAGAWAEALSSEDRIRVAASGALAMEYHSPWLEKFHITHVDGTVRRVLARGIPIIDVHGTFHGYRGSMRVISNE